MLTGSPFACWALASPARLAISKAHTRTTRHRRIVGFLLRDDVDLWGHRHGASQRVSDRRRPDRVLPQLSQYVWLGVGLHVELRGHLVESRVAVGVEAQEHEVV